MVLKFDMNKAYDTLSWLGLIRIMRNFGFGERWLDMVWRFLSNYWYSVLVNGQTNGFFQSNRGLRQGDFISPYLFILAAESLSKGLIFLHQNYKDSNYYCRPWLHVISHLAYADDNIVFCNSSTKSVKLHMTLFEQYHILIGQDINPNKSFFIAGRDDKIENIKAITKFQQNYLTMPYLGCPLYPGVAKRRVLTKVIEKML